MSGEAGGYLGLDVLQRGVGVGAGDAAEGGKDAVQQTTGLLHRNEGVLEGGRGWIVGDGIDLGALLGHAGLNCGQVVGVFNLVEGRCLIWKCAGGGKRI